MTRLEDIFDFTTDNVRPEMGRLLVAGPFLKDDYFERAVIALVTVSQGDGAMGLVLGNKSESTLGDIMPDLMEGRDIPVYIGGPLSDDHLFYVHTLGRTFEPDARPLGNGLWLGTKPDAAITAAGLGIFPEDTFRFFVGYCGWGKGQLETEIEENTWALTDGQLSAEALLGLSDDRLWHYAVSTFGDRYRHWLLQPRVPFAN